MRTTCTNIAVNISAEVISIRRFLEFRLQFEIQHRQSLHYRIVISFNLLKYAVIL